ncbi:MAG: hypothetical protein JWO05_3705 [Gemmatimonadetes bacterium]|nr:hypothetical protein [Gemmatimonadota bacterium]
MHDDEDDAMTPETIRAAQALRADVLPTEAWSEAVVQRAMSARRARGWFRVGAGMLAAAGVAFAAGLLVGGRDTPRAATAVAARDSGNVPVQTVAWSEAGADSGIARFVAVAPDAQSVEVVGDFNLWARGRTPLARMADGRTWSVQLPLGVGRHTYAFVIDGQLVRDRNAPASADDDFGVPSSVLLVQGRR